MKLPKFHAGRSAILTVTLMRKALVALSLAIGLLISGTAVFVNTGDVLTRKLGLDKQLLSCIPVEVWNPDVNSMNVDDGCIQKVMVEALETGKIDVIKDVMVRMDSQSNLHGHCHAPAHAAGGQVLERNHDWSKSVTLADYGLCSSGLLHGVFDSLGKETLSPAEWLKVTAWCSNVGERRREQGNCGDGIGHAAWDSTGDVGKALDICAAIAFKSLRSPCAEGLIMQHYSPISRPSDRTIITEDQVLGICEPSEGRTDDLREGCLRGIGYAVATQLQLRDTTTGEFLAPSKMNPLLEEGAAFCARFGDEAPLCLGRFWEVVFEFVHEKPEPVEIVCRAVPSIEADCRKYLSTFNL